MILADEKGTEWLRSTSQCQDTSPELLRKISALPVAETKFVAVRPTPASGSGLLNRQIQRATNISALHSMTCNATILTVSCDLAIVLSS